MMLNRYVLSSLKFFSVLAFIVCSSNARLFAQTAPRTRLVSVDANGNTNGGPFAITTPNGRYVLYQSNQSSLFVRDLASNTLTLVSVDMTGKGMNNYQAFVGSITPDGRYVAFISDATNLVPNVSQPDFNVYVRDLVAGKTILVSVNKAGLPAGRTKYGVVGQPGIGLAPLISNDGRYVFFQSDADDLVDKDTNQATDLFMRDLQTNKTVLVSVNYAGTDSAKNRRFICEHPDIPDACFPEPDYTFHPVITPDGRYVAFQSYAPDLVANDTVCNGVCNGNNSYEDVFVRDLNARTTTLASSNYLQTDGASKGAALNGISDDGRFVLFTSNGKDIVPFDLALIEDPSISRGLNVFVYDAKTNVTHLVSLNRAGTMGGDDDSFGEGMSADGRTIIFRSQADDLIEGNKLPPNFRLENIYASAFPTGIGQFQFNSPAYAVNGTETVATITVTRTANSDDPATVNYAATPGTASPRTDFTPAFGTLFFAAGETSKTFTVLLTPNSLAQNDRTVNLTLSNPFGATLGQQTTATLTIHVNQSPSSTNPIDDAGFFVRQQYHDFLNREADTGGLNFWTNQIQSCGGDAACIDLKRQNVSAAFFLSTEFQQTGMLVYLSYKAAYLRPPSLAEFSAGVQALQRGVIVGADGWEKQLEMNKRFFAYNFADRAAFKQKYPSPLDAAQLYLNAGVPIPYGTGTGLISIWGLAPADVLLDVAQNKDFAAREFNDAFVLMEYFGYLRRDPDTGGYNFWLQKLNQFNGDYIASQMVRSFIISAEYRTRFGGQ